MTTSLVVLLLALLGASTTRAASPIIGSVTYDPNRDSYTYHNGDSTHWVARARFTDSIHENGWSFLELETDDATPDSIQAVAAGYLEGYLTSDLIYKSWRNTVQWTCYGETYCSKVREYIESNKAWIYSFLENKRKTDPFWHQVGLFFEQLKGMEEGYKAATAGKGKKIGDYGIWWLNLQGDMQEMIEKYSGTSARELRRKFANDDRRLSAPSCSALIKFTPNFEELFIGHVTWIGYYSMLRVIKKYTFGFHTTSSEGASNIPGYTQSFSSYPGVIFSMDDFVLSSTGLAITETTLYNANPELWKHISPTSGVYTCMRSTAANRLATTSKEWTDIFSRYNSGTFCNEWLILDYKKFTKNRSLGDGAFWVLEQLPGKIVKRDLTSQLNQNSHFSGYNLAYFPEIFDLSGFNWVVNEYGDWFSHDMNPRGRIMRRNQSDVFDLTSMRNVMRYNNYWHDPLSVCDECWPDYTSATNAISARKDLNKKYGWYPVENLGHEGYGGTDVKISNSLMRKTFDMHIQAGPTNDQVPTFKWSTAPFRRTMPHYGHPDVWNFRPVNTNWAFPLY